MSRRKEFQNLGKGPKILTLNPYVHAASLWGVSFNDYHSYSPIFSIIEICNLQEDIFRIAPYPIKIKIHFSKFTPPQITTFLMQIKGEPINFREILAIPKKISDGKKATGEWTCPRSSQ